MLPTSQRPATAGRRGPYAKTAAVRQRILETCIEVFSESGFYGATMKEIAQRAAISQTGLLHHFGSKEELLAAVLVERYRQSASVISAAPPADYFQSQMHVIRDNVHRPGLIQLQSIISSEATSPTHPAHQYFTERFDDFRLYLTTLFTELRDAGKLLTDAHPQNLASLYIAVQDGLQLQWLYNRSAVDIEDGVRSFLRLVISEEAFSA